MRLKLPLEISYELYRWFKGEAINPYRYSLDTPLAATFWEYEKEFHFSYLNNRSDKPLDKAYQEWKNGFINDLLPGKSPNPYGDTTDWEKVFNTGLR